MTEPPPAAPSSVRRGPPPPPVSLSSDDRASRVSAIDELYELATLEVESGDARRRDDLKARLALLAWDGRGDAEDAARWLVNLDHPAAFALRLDLALAGAGESIARIAGEALHRIKGPELAEFGEVLLYRGEELELAIALLEAAGSDGRDGLIVALGVAGRHADLAALLERSGAREELLTAAAIVQDRLDDRDSARALVRRAQRAPGDVEDAYLCERLLELGGDERALQLRAKLAILGMDPAVAAERAATQFELAMALEAARPDEAGALLQLLAADGSEFGVHLALRARLRVAAARRDWTDEAAAWSALGARGGGTSWARACARRAAELLDGRSSDPATAEAIVRRLLASDPGHAMLAARAVRFALLRHAPADAAPVLEALGRAGGEQGHSAFVRAARAAEVAESMPPWSAPAGALRSIDRWRAVAGPLGHREALRAIARAHRRAGEKSQVAQIYRRLAAHVDDRRGAAHLTVAGALSLDAGERREADDLLREAIAREPADLLAHAARSLAARESNRSRDLAEALRAEVDLVLVPAVRARLLRQLGRVAAVELGDLATAESSFARALEIEPDDAATLYDLGRISGDLGKWEQAVALRERAASMAPAATGAAWLCEVGEIHERGIAGANPDDERAQNAYQRALSLDERSRKALTALAALHRKHRRLPELLEILRGELRAAADRETRLKIHLDIARAADDPTLAAHGVEVALEAWRDALRIDALNAEALAGIEQVCRREGRWADLAEVLVRVPQVGSAHTLHVLGEAFEQLGEWTRLAEIREQEVSLPEALADRSRMVGIARSLAVLYEQKLDDLDGAARAWHRVDEAAPDVEAIQALQRIYESRGRFADLAAAIERELGRFAAPESTLAVDVARALALWLRLGEVRRASLGRPGPAAEAYERALGLDPGNADALAALAELYARLDRPRDLERVIDLRASTTVDPSERAALTLQKGEIMEKSGDLDGALAAFSDAFGLDPSSRPAFTALERACYRRERWHDAMALYDRAIDLVEVKKSRAYRLADLHARRGQVQLQYLAQPGEAAASYLRVIDLDPDSEVAQTALERIFSMQSDWTGLISAYERRAELLKDDGKRTEVLRRAARVASARLHDPRRAATIYERLHSVDPTDGEALDALERHFETSREWDKLIEVLRTRLALTAGGDDAIKLHLRIASLCEDGKHDPELAIEAYRKILDFAPSHRGALDALGRLYEGTEKWGELVDVTRRQIRVVTDRTQKAILYFKCGSVMESKFGKDEEAIRYYDAAIRTSPSCLPAVHGLRDLYLRREDWPQVVKSLELEAKLWTEEKERAGVLAHIGAIYGDKLYDVDRAIWYFESAIAVDKECLAANRSLFEVYFARRDFVRAMPLGQILTQKVMREGDPAERSDFYRKRAIVARETGDLPSAAESLVVALEIRPEHIEALELLVDLCRAHAEAYDFAGTFRELEKLYRKRDSKRLLARVLVGQGALCERQYEIDRAEELFRAGLALAPEDYPVVDALVTLHVRLLRFDQAASIIEGFLASAPPGDKAARARGRLRIAEIFSDGAMDPQRAADALRALIAEQPGHREGHFRLAQELYLLGNFSEAHKVCERLIQLAAAPGTTSPPEDLARYYDYVGRIAEAMGDANAATRSYRRAIDLDPAYPPPVLALARRAAAIGDLSQAAALCDQAHRAALGRGAEALLELQRGLARFYASLDERARAIDLFRQILAREPNSADDRVALASLYALDGATIHLAREELQVVLLRDLRHAPAYRLLEQLYAWAGETARASRVGAVLKLFGYSEREEHVDQPFRGRLRRGTLTETLRRTQFLPAIVSGAFSEALHAVREPLELAYPPPPLGNLTVSADPGLRSSAIEVQRLLEVEAEVLVGDAVPGGVVAFESPRPVVVIDGSLAARPDRERRFLLGRALEPLRGGYAMPLRLRPAQRAELGRLLDQLLRPEANRDPPAQQLVEQLPRKSARAVEKLAGLDAGGTIDAWYAALAEAADRAGLLACDDIGAAVSMMARIAGEELALSSDGAVTLGQVTGDNAIVRFYLSDAYHELRSALGEPTLP